MGSDNSMKDVIGKGLFSSILIRKGDIIADFIGEFTTKVLANSRDKEGFGGYMIAIKNNVVLDCYNYTHICKASMASCPTNCFDRKSRTMAVANAKLTIDHKRRKTSLRALHNIPPNVEILWHYGVNYRYPITS